MNQTLTTKISRKFNIPPLRYVSKAKGGFLSDNYVVMSGNDKFFLKQYRTAVHDRLSVIAKAERFFANENIPVIMPIKAKDGRTVVKVQEHFYSLFPFIPGKTFDHKKDRLTPAIANSIASNLAMMHKLSKKGFPLISTKALAEWDAEKVFSKNAVEEFYEYGNKIIALLKNKKQKNNFDKTAGIILREKLKLAREIPKQFNTRALGKKHIVHGDYHAQNLFLNRHGAVTHVFDLEKSDIRPRSLELIRSIMIICFNGYYDKRRFKLAKIYLRAYKSIYPIKDKELDSAIRFMYYKHILNLWIEKGHYFNNYKRADMLLAGELRFLRYMSKNLDKFVRKLA